MLSFFEDLLAEEMLPAACIVEARKTGEICRSLLQLLEIELWPIGKYELWDQNIFKTQLRGKLLCAIKQQLLQNEIKWKGKMNE